jgi:hypothetical protein
MLTIPGFHHRPTRAIAGALAGLLTLAAAAAASPADLREIGAADVQGGGYWGIEVMTGESVIAAGQTFARVTDDDCSAPSASAIVFETQLQPTESGDSSWAGLLAPMGPAAERLAAPPTFEGQVHMEPVAGGGTRVTSYLEGMPDGVTLHLCLGSSGR